MPAYYHYFVEGDTDRKMTETLKTQLQYILPGKVQVFNVVERRLNRSHLMLLKNGTTVILVFDTDTEHSKILQENISLLKKEKHIKAVICIPQVKNLEDELVRSCTIRTIKELTDSRTDAGFKADMLKCNHFDARLEKCAFNFKLFWSSKPDGAFQNIVNDALKIKLR